MNAAVTFARTVSIVRTRLLEGYGVEDIALMHSVPLSSVRYEVEQLRASGDLGRMFPCESGRIS